jgi:DNA-binding transcriptional MerR regulator
MEATDRLSLDQLEERSGVPARQVRELIRQGVLPPASSGGRGATYGAEHLDRLRAWKRLRQESPAGTTTEQLRRLLDHLQDSGMLRAIADGTIPFALIDDEKDEVTVKTARQVRGDVRLPAESFHVADAAFMFAPSPDDSPRPASEGAPAGAPANDEAFAYLQSMRSTAPRPAARVRLQPSTATTHLEVNLRESERSAAAVSLTRLRDALDAYVAAHAAGVRASPSRSEVWHRVVVGRDLEITARGPLSPDEVRLLETIGQLLQQAVYRRSR